MMRKRPPWASVGGSTMAPRSWGRPGAGDAQQIWDGEQELQLLPCPRPCHGQRGELPAPPFLQPASPSPQLSRWKLQP